MAEGVQNRCMSTWASVVAGLLVLIVGLAFSVNRTLADPDVFLHTKTGYWIMANGVAPSLDPYSIVMLGQPWVAHEWLAQLLMGVSHEVLGWFGVLLLAAGAFALTMALQLNFLWQRFEPIRAIALSSFSFAGLLTHFMARPHVLVWPLMAWWVGSLLVAAEKEKTPGFGVLVGLWLWVNMHGSFILAFVLLAFVAADAVIQNRRLWRPWTVFLLLSVLVVMINPLGWQVLMFPFDLHAGQLLTEISEWRRPEFYNASPVWLMLALILVYVLLGRMKVRPLNWILIAALSYQAGSHGRYISIAAFLIPYFVLSTSQRGALLPLTSENKARCRGVVSTVLAGTFVVVVAFATLKTYHPAHRITADRALEAVRAHGVSGNVLNSYRHGGFLIFNEVPVFIDGRYDLYGDAHLARYFEATRSPTPESLRDLLDAYNIKWTLFPVEASINKTLGELPGWAVLHEDDAAQVFIRRQTP